MTDTATTTEPTSTEVPSPQERSARLTLWETVSFNMAHAATSAMLAILSLRGLYHFGRLFGTAEYLINFKRRRRFAKALAHILEQKPTGAQRRKWTHQHFMMTRCEKLFYLIMDRLPRDKAASLLTISDEPLLKEYLARGNGLFYGLAHLGPQHIGGMLLSLKGYKVAGVRDPHESSIRRYVQALFDRRHPDIQRTNMLYSGTFPREIFRCYREGCIVGSAMDVSRLRSQNQKAEWIEVFGQKRPFLTGPLHIAIRCKAPMLHGHVLPEPGFRFRFLIAGTLLDPETMEDEDREVANALRIYAAHIEKTLKERPSLVTRI